MSSTQQLSFVTLDVFTSTPYKGNPLAIVKLPLNTTLTQNQKQTIAREFNLSETVFLHEQTKDEKQSCSVTIDIFTALAEVPFAGHPTVGTANYLLRLLKGDTPKGVEALNLKAGRFPISKTQANDGVTISVAHHVHLHESSFKHTSFGQYPVFSIVKGMTFILAQLPDLAALEAQKRGLIDNDKTYTSLSTLDAGWREGLVASYFFVDVGYRDGIRTIRTRMYASREDPATGSAASALTSYLSLQEGKAGTYRYEVVQGVEMGRESHIFVEVGVKENGGKMEVEEVLLTGTAVQVMEGSLNVPADG